MMLMKHAMDCYKKCTDASLPIILAYRHVYVWEGRYADFSVRISLAPPCEWIQKSPLKIDRLPKVGKKLMAMLYMHFGG